MANRNTTQELSYSLVEVSRLKGFTVNALNYWATKSKITPVRINLQGTRFYTENQVNEILKLAPSYAMMGKSVKAIFLHLQDYNALEIAYGARLGTVKVYKLIEEFNADGVLTVESKLNYML